MIYEQWASEHDRRDVFWAGDWRESEGNTIIFIRHINYQSGIRDRGLRPDLIGVVCYMRKYISQLDNALMPSFVLSSANDHDHQNIAAHWSFFLKSQVAKLSKYSSKQSDPNLLRVWVCRQKLLLLYEAQPPTKTPWWKTNTAEC